MPEVLPYTDAVASSFFYVKLDTDGICRYANEAYFNRFTEFKNKFLGRSYKEIVVADDVKNLEEGISFCLQHPGKLFHTVIRKPSARGNPYYCYCEFAADLDEEGNVIGINCTGFEITPFKEAEKAAATVKEEHHSVLSEYLEKFKQLSYITSHELRHEYAKLQTIVLGVENNILGQSEIKQVLGEIKNSIGNLNITISKLNDQLSFGQSPIFNGNTKAVYSKAILIDDDDVLNYLNKKMLLRHCPEMEVETFDNARKALEYLKENDKFGDYLIFLDLNMPIMTGWDFLDQYKSYPIQSKVIILTSSIDIQDKLHAHEYKNVMDFLPKPLTLDELNKIFDENPLPVS